MKGSVSPNEGLSFHDPATGARVRQVTSHASINHPSYFLHGSFLPGDERLFFTSYRTGSAQLFLASFPEGDIVQLTDGPAIHPFSAVLHPFGETIVFVRGGSFQRLCWRSFEELPIIEPGANTLGPAAESRAADNAFEHGRAGQLRA